MIFQINKRGKGKKEIHGIFRDGNYLKKEKKRVVEQFINKNLSYHLVELV